MRYNLYRIKILLVRLDFPKLWVGIHWRKYSWYLKRINTLVHTTSTLAIPYFYSIEPAIVNAKTEALVSFCYKHYWWCPLCYCMLGDTIFFYLSSSTTSKFCMFETCTICCVIYWVGNLELKTVLFFATIILPSQPFLGDFYFCNILGNFCFNLPWFLLSCTFSVQYLSILWMFFSATFQNLSRLVFFIWEPLKVEQRSRCFQMLYPACGICTLQFYSCCKCFQTSRNFHLFWNY